MLCSSLSQGDVCSSHGNSSFFQLEEGNVEFLQMRPVLGIHGAEDSVPDVEHYPKIAHLDFDVVSI